ncbi:MAG: GxGYxYP domain-containing protein [Bacteroidota bacterium]
MSHEIGLYATLSLEIRLDAKSVTVIQRWGTSRFYVDSVTVTLNGPASQVPVSNRVWPANVFMGLSMPVGGSRRVSATTDNKGILTIEEQYDIQGSQGASPISVRHSYAVSEGSQVLTYTMTRPTRPSDSPVTFVLKRPGYREAFFTNIKDNWEIEGDLPSNALLISLQGLANTDGPRMYLQYPNWPFTYVESVFEFYRDKRHFTFTELKTVGDALKQLREHIKGYVVWDKKVRTSLIVAFTVAGLERAIVVSEELIPEAKRAGLKPVEDFRGKFTGKSDAEIYQWAYDRYWERCSRDYIVWLGGEHGSIMKPGVADFGIAQKVFFNDLSSRPTDKLEYGLARKVLSQMNPMAMVMGWHSYAKDLEREHVTLTSSFGLRVEGLHTLPNLSFSSKVPASPGFKFKNNHNLIAGKDYTPKNKVYITAIQTDGIGLGAWLKPGRGEIPYAWEVLMNYVWMAPAMAEYFYTMATPNDYFIGCLSGPGYMYPKAVPPNLLPPLLAKAKEYMDVLDLTVFEIMDYSEGATVEGNSELTRDVVDAYYKAMPDAIGFVNGYAPSHTFAVRNGKPLISYDYYLSPTRPEADAVADLEELAAINKNRPYFLLMHVREWSDIKRVKGILDRLGPEFELIPLDVFLTMAGKNPTFKEKFLER